MNALDQQFHIAQSRLKRQRIPMFSVELTTDNALSNKQRMGNHFARLKAYRGVAGEARRAAA